MIKIKGLCHVYNPYSEEKKVVALNNINLTIKDEEIVVIIGPSGSGKSTLLRCINRLLEPTAGKIFIDGEEILHSSSAKAETIRRKIGMVFQDFNLLKRSLVIENVLMGRLGYISTFKSFLGKYAYTEKDNLISLECLEKVGIKDLVYRRVDSLSGGQQQRVGIARALAQKPSIILGDEPVSNLDSSTGKDIMNLLYDIHEKDRITMIISMHNVELAKKYADRIVKIERGEIVLDKRL